MQLTGLLNIKLIITSNPTSSRCLIRVTILNTVSFTCHCRYKVRDSIMIIMQVNVYQTLHMINGRHKNERPQTMFNWMYILKRTIYGAGTINQVTKSMQQNPSQEDNGFSVNKKFPTFYQNPNVLYSIHKSKPLVPILHQTNPVHAFPLISIFILILSSYLCLSTPSGFLLRS